MDVIKPNYVTRKYPYTTLMNCEFYNHKHSFWEFIICIGGSACHIINEKRHSFFLGDIIIMKPDSTHNYKILNKKSNKYLHYDFYATSAEMKKACRVFDEKLYERIAANGEPVRLSPDLATLNMLEHKLSHLNTIQLAPKFERLAANIYSNILTFICGLIAENEIAAADQIPEWLSSLMSTMFKPEILCGNLSQVVEQSGYTHSHLCRLFKSHMGITLIEYFTQLKIDYASVLLKNKSLKIIDIAQLLGYNSPSHFIQVFKKYNAITPKQYRRTLHI